MGSRGYTRAESGWLLSEDSDACAFGEPEWKRVNGTWRGRIEVGAGNFDPGDLALELNLRPMQPTEPTVVYIVRDKDLGRVDVNGGHKGRRFTHRQHHKIPDDVEVTSPETVSWFVPVPLGPDIEDDVLVRALRDAAHWLCVNTSAVEWILPSWREQ